MLKFKLNDFSFIYTIINAYITMALISLVVNPASNSRYFFELDKGLSPGVVLLVWGLFFIVFLIIEKYYQLESKRLASFVSLATLFLTTLALLSPAPTIIVGLLLLQFMIFMFLYYSPTKQKLLQAIASLGLIISIVKLAFVVGQTPQLVEEYAFNFSPADTNLLIVILSAIALAVFIYYLLQKSKSSLLTASTSRIKRVRIICWAVLILQTLIISIMLWARIKTFTSPTYDMGIFSQMFANMSKGLGPLTTLERDQVLSHFAVHISPIHYLLLPFYMLIPRAETIQVLQVLVVLSGIIPFYLILKEFNFSKNYQRLLLFLYLWIPALTTSHFYDYHENCFLAPLLLWLFYTTIKKQAVKSWIVVVLTLMVKEDAMIYVLALGGYFLFQERFKFNKREQLLIFLTQIVMPLIYFVIAVSWLQTEGDGAMTTRFTNFMLPGEESLVNVILNALSNPQFTLANFFTLDKLSYLLFVLACQAFLPLMQANWAHYILFIPLLVINLLSNWPYQYDLFKQYHYGSSVLLLILTLLALDSLQSLSHKHVKKVKPPRVRIQPKLLALTATTVSLFSLIFLVQPRFNLVQNYTQNPLHYQTIQKTLDQIPREAQVLSFTRFTTPLADIFYLYDLFYHNDQTFDPEIDYVVFERTLLTQDKKERAVVSQYLQNGYRESEYSSDYLMILESP